MSVRTYDGRYASIVSTLPGDCGRQIGDQAQADEVPEIFAGANREGEVVYKSNNCVVYYGPNGGRTRALPACSDGQLARADDGMARYRREQGLSGPVASHSATAINLICYGEGQKPGYTTNSGYNWDYEQHRYVYGTRSTYAQQDFDAQVQLQFQDGEARIRLPKKLIPPINSGGRNGWWTMSNVSVGSMKITGRYSLNGANKPKVEIDRRSGRIRIDGLSDFRGTCDEIDHGQRRF